MIPSIVQYVFLTMNSWAQMNNYSYSARYKRWRAWKILSFQVYLANYYIKLSNFRNIAFYQRYESFSNMKSPQHSPDCQLLLSHSFKTPEIWRDHLLTVYSILFYEYVIILKHKNILQIFSRKAPFSSNLILEK